MGVIGSAWVSIISNWFSNRSTKVFFQIPLKSLSNYTPHTRRQAGRHLASHIVPAQERQSFHRTGRAGKMFFVCAEFIFHQNGAIARMITVALHEQNRRDNERTFPSPRSIIFSGVQAVENHVTMNLQLLPHTAHK